MGGRGAFSEGLYKKDTYEKVDEIAGVKVLKPISKSASLKLPEEAKTSKSYVLLDKEGVFHQYREYNNDHKVVLEIGYHHEASLGKGDILHIHIHQKAGIDFHNDSTTTKRKLTREEYTKYKKFFKGVILDERKYFS